MGCLFSICLKKVNIDSEKKEDLYKEDAYSKDKI